MSIIKLKTNNIGNRIFSKINNTKNKTCSTNSWRRSVTITENRKNNRQQRMKAINRNLKRKCKDENQWRRIKRVKRRNLFVNNLEKKIKRKIRRIYLQYSINNNKGFKTKNLIVMAIKIVRKRLKLRKHRIKMKI